MCVELEVPTTKEEAETSQREAETGEHGSRVGVGSTGQRQMVLVQALETRTQVCSMGSINYQSNHSKSSPFCLSCFEWAPAPFKQMIPDQECPQSLALCLGLGLEWFGMAFVY